MAISPPRAFAFGACTILIAAGTFAAGIHFGARSASEPDHRAAASATRITCPSPGFTATRSATERARNCEDARAVQKLLLETGISAANVSVLRKPSSERLGPETVTTVVAQVFLTGPERRQWDAESAAFGISRAVATPIEHVTITDESLRVLYDGPPHQPAIPAQSM